MLEYLSTLFAEPLAFFDQAIYRVIAVLIGLCCHEWAFSSCGKRGLLTDGGVQASHCGDFTAEHGLLRSQELQLEGPAVQAQ